VNCLTPQEAQAINMMWDGARNDLGTRIWHPFERGANASVSSSATCGNLGSQCWAHEDTTFDWHPLQLSQFDDEFELATNVVAPYSDIMSTALHAARNSGAKILMWHGGADPLIPHRQAIHYYNDAIDTFGALDNVTPWFRFFMAPGVGHCGGGVGPQPQNLFGVLVDWVENGVAPDSILSTNSSGGVVTRSRPLYGRRPRSTTARATNDAASFLRRQRRTPADRLSAWSRNSEGDQKRLRHHRPPAATCNENSNCRSTIRPAIRCTRLISMRTRVGPSTPLRVNKKHAMFRCAALRAPTCRSPRRFRNWRGAR
jgi:hypothetical protein